MLVTKKLIQNWLPPRKKDSHKGDFGHVLIIAGSRNLSGAATLCGWGALRGGAGLVTIAVPKSIQPSLLKWLRPEAMTLPLPETKEGSFSTKSVPLLIDFIKKRKITSLALGPGLSRHSYGFVQNLLMKIESLSSQIQGIVLDADGFLALTPKGSHPSLLQKISLPLIVTPHAGEMAKFMGTTPALIQKDRIAHAKKFAKLYRVVAVLKGDQTVTTDGEKIYINSTGCPGMARGGSGDILTGLISALVAQVKGPDFLMKAAVLGVYLHGLAGEIAQKNKTEVAMLSGEIAQALPQAFKYLLEVRHSGESRNPAKRDT